jgi:hypothetical protein
LDRIDQVNPIWKGDGKYYYAASAGEGVHVYVIDSGIYLNHQECTGRIGNGYDFVDDDNDPNDTCLGHGTAVAGIIGGTIYGVAKKVTLHPVRIINCDDGVEDSLAFIEGVQWVIENHIDPAVINMSLHTYMNLKSLSTTLFENEVNEAINAGITVVVSAGNNNVNACNQSPARIPKAITVGAINLIDEKCSFSNYGKCVDIFAPGKWITSAGISSSSAPVYLVDGTSIATPFVTGAVALYLAANPNASPNQVSNYIINSATAGKLSKTGVGSPNLLLRVSTGKPETIQLSSPKNGKLTNDRTPTITWNIGANSNSYHVQVSTSNKFSSKKYDFKTSNTHYTLGSLADGKYYWRVSAYNPIGVEGEWSSVFSFTIDTKPPSAPILKSPVNNSIVSSYPTFSWYASNETVKYIFAYGTSIDPDSHDFIVGDLVTTSYKPETIPVGTKVYWFVRALDLAGNLGDWSNPFAITVLSNEPTPTTGIPGQVANTSPGSGYVSTNDYLYLAWDSTANAYTYQVQIDNASNFSSVDYLLTSAIEVNKVYAGPIDNGTWYWRVRARNEEGEYGPWSSTNQLIISNYTDYLFKSNFNTNGDYEGWTPILGTTSTVYSGNLLSINSGYYQTNYYWYSSLYYSPDSYENVVFEARMKMDPPIPEGMEDYGVIVRGTPSSDEENMYGWESGFLFKVHLINFDWPEEPDLDGQHAWYSYDRIEDGFDQYNEHQDGCLDTVINYSDYNTIKAIANGESVNFYINDVLVYSVIDDNVAEGRVGFYSSEFENSWDEDDGQMVYVDWARASIPSE